MPKKLLLLAVLLLLSWCVMTLTHEAGHIVGGWCAGGTLKSAELRPWKLPYSTFHPDPAPLFTLWCGPVLGALVPWLIARSIGDDRVWFVAWFCVLANGLYLATSWVTGDQYLDTPQMLKHGAWPLSIAAYCLTTILFGYHGLRRHGLRLFADQRSDIEDTPRPSK